jgi:DNA-binding IclR family transcriptional regulator
MPVKKQIRKEQSRPEKMLKTASTSRSLVPALEQGVQTLLCLQRNLGQKMNLTTICQSVGIHKSKGYSILTTLQKYGLVERDPAAKTYTLGARLIPLARAVLDHLDYRAAAAPVVEELARETGMTVWFGLRMNDSLFVVSKYEPGEHFWATPGIGHSFNLFEGAHGKAVLAFLPEQELKAVLSARKVTNGLRKEFPYIRQLGFAADLGEFARGINAVAAPVVGPAQHIAGVLLLFGSFPQDKVEKYGRKTAAAAKRISHKLGS